LELNFIETVVDSKVRGGVYTILPAKVTNVNNFQKNQIINAIPLVGRLYQEDQTYLEPREIFNIPVIFPSAGGGILSFPIKKDDGVLLLFSMRDLDNWEDSNGIEILPPLSSRMHSVTDAIAIAGLYTKNNNLSPNPTDVEIKFSGSSIKMKPNGDIEETVAGNRVFNVTGNFDINSTLLRHNGTNVGDTHVHSQNSDSDEDSQQNTNGPQ
jgi:hypothetical protein